MIDVIDLTQKLVRCASVTPEDAGCQKILKDVLIQYGFEIFDLPFEGRGGTYPIQNFFARKGTTAPHFCYAGHTDVVPVGDEKAWKYPPFSATIDGDLMYGRGTSDMKAGNTAFAAAVSQFLETHADFEGSISFLITGDEEAEATNGTVRVLEWMKDNNHIPDVALVGESSNLTQLGEEIKIGRRGSFGGVLHVQGTQGHVAYPHMADNPMPRLCAMGSALSTYQFDEGTEFFSATNLEISTMGVENKTANVIPADGSLKFNIRYNDKWTAETLDKKLREILDTVSTKYTLTINDSAHPFITQTGEFTSLVQDIVTQETGRTPALTTGGGTSDARFIAPYCPVLEFGLTNETIHKVDECLSVTDLQKLVIIYEQILVKYFSK